MRILLLDYGKPEARYDWSELEVEFDITIVSIPPSWEVADSVDEKFHSFLIDKVINQKFDLIFVPVSVTNAYSSYTGMRLGMHLRLSNLPSLSLERRLVPIIFMGFETELQVFKQSEYAQFLLTPSVFYIQHTIKAVKYVIENIPSVDPIELNAFLESLSLYPIQPEPHLESSHSLANEWGAFELDRFTVNCLKDKPNNLDFNLYIKWLECQFGVDRKTLNKKGLEIPEIISGKKILYIDDEWDKRWNDVLEGVFETAMKFKCLKTIRKGLEREEVIKLVEAAIKNTDWDLILLDLRLTESDHDGRQSDFTGESILEFVKGEIQEIEEEDEDKFIKKVQRVVREGHNPTLPVIMFTASTKARIIDSLYEKGADGHFIKHGPSDSRTSEKVKESVQAFLNTIKNCLEKGASLQPFWKRIKEIKNANLIKGKERITPEGKQTKFEERIIERLIMFVGLLKKANEQTNFDQSTFFFDQYETAFLTLWSCLNDLVACYYIRSQPYITTKEGKTVHEKDKNLRRISYPANKYKWKDVFNDEVFVKYDDFSILNPAIKNGLFKLRYEQLSCLIYTWNSGSYYKISKDSNGTLTYQQPLDNNGYPIDYQKTLANQVSFLIYSVGKYLNIDDAYIGSMWSNLKASNDCRNSLALTHSDLLNKAYLTHFASTVEETRKNETSVVKNESYWKTEISRLFNLVNYLVTGLK